MLCKRHNVASMLHVMIFCINVKRLTEVNATLSKCHDADVNATLYKRHDVAPMLYKRPVPVRLYL